MAGSVLGPTTNPLVQMYGDLVPLVATANFNLDPLTGLWVSGSTAGGVYNSTLPTLTSTKRGELQLTSNSELVVALFGTTGNQMGNGFPNADGAALGSNLSLAVQPTSYTFNGTSWDRFRGNIDTAALQTLTLASAGTTNSADQINYNGRGVQIGVNITATTGQTLTVHVQGKDAASGSYYDILVSTALAAVAFTNLTVYPGSTASANLDVNAPLPRTWRVQAVVAGAGSTLSATIGASVIL